MPARSLYLATPLYGGNLQFGYHTSVCSLINLCHSRRVRLLLKYVSCDSLVPRARNNLVYFFLKSGCTDLLFVDADITFRAEDALSLLDHEEAIVGGVYPRKQHDWTRISKAARLNCSPSLLAEQGFIAVMNWAGEGDYPLDRIFPVRQLGTGFMRIRREVFTTLISRLGDSITFDYASEEGRTGETGYDFFPTGPDVRYPLGSGGRQYLSEDWSFCELARQCGFTPHADPRIKLVHSGLCDYSGDLSVMDAAIEEELNAAAT